MAEGKSSWRFPRTFWTGNGAELCERAAYYGTFIALRTYLIRVVGLDDVEAGVVAGMFGGWIYLVPFFTGAAADRMGFRKALILAFSLLTVGYGMLGVFSTLPPVLVGLALIVLGGAFVKPVITGTVAKSSDDTNRARAFSIFYMVVNIGSFTGKTIVAPMRIEMGVDTVPFFSAGACLLALFLVILIYKPPKGEGEPPGEGTETQAEAESREEPSPAARQPETPSGVVVLGRAKVIGVSSEPRPVPEASAEAREPLPELLPADTVPGRRSAPVPR